MIPKTFFQLHGEDGLKDAEEYKRRYVPSVGELETDEIVLSEIKPSQEELEYLISWGEIARALEYASKHKIRANPFKYLVSRVIRYGIDTGADLVSMIQNLFWEEAV